jgi:mannitol/fructose-specific phosphotransferase system IIA component (Ntr-type)
VASGDFEAAAQQLLHGDLEDGLAILHTLSTAVEQTLLILALAPGGVTLKGQSCQVVAVLISPLKDSGAPLQTLSRLTALLHSRSFRHCPLGGQRPFVSPGFPAHHAGRR